MPIFPILYLVLPEVQLLGPNRTLLEGENANLTCVIKVGSPKPRLSWYRNGKLLVDKENTNLILTEVTDEDEGLYRCRAQNRGGVANDFINVTVDSKYSTGAMDMGW